MKKFTGMLLAILILAFSLNAFGAAVVTKTEGRNPRDGVNWVIWEWTSHTDGTLSGASNTTIVVDGWVFQAVTDPAATAPTDNYDITITDSDNADVMGGELANRDTANSEQVVPSVGSTYGPRFCKGTLTLAITNAGNTKQGTIILYWMKR